MDLIQNYGSDVSDGSNHSDNEEALPQPVLKKMHIDVAPSVTDTKTDCESLCQKPKPSVNDLEIWKKSPPSP